MAKKRLKRNVQRSMTRRLRGCKKPRKESPKKKEK